MSSFPLFDSLQTNLVRTKLTLDQKKEFMKTVSEIDKDGRDLVYALVKFYYEKKGEVMHTIDQNRKAGSISFNLVKFPTELQQLLYKFTMLHIKRMKENKQRNSRVIAASDRVTANSVVKESRESEDEESEGSDEESSDEESSD